MQSYPLKLTSIVMLFVAFTGWTGSQKLRAETLAVDPAPTSAPMLWLTGDLRFYRHIDAVTGGGAVAIHADGKDIPLDFRQFKLDILLHSGPHRIRGYWSTEQRLVVTEAHPTGCRTALLP